MSGKAALGGDRGPDRPHRAGEGHEEGVALGADLHAAARLDGLAHDRRVLVPDRWVAVAQLLQQPGGTLDVGEQEGDRPVGSATMGGRRPSTDPGATAWELAANRSLNSVARSSPTSRPSSAGVRKYQ
jgi:hypothetical protein